MSNSDEPPSSSLSSPSLFSSLPLDIVLNVIARVPKRYYPILCCVSKNLRDLVRSPEIHKTRSLLGKDSLYICFKDISKYPGTCHWFTLRRIENNTTENVFVSIDIPLLPELFHYCHFAVAVGPEIFFFPGWRIPSSSFWIFDTQSGKFRQGPSLQVKRFLNIVGLVGGKIYVIRGYKYKKITAEVFDIKAQTWEAAPIPVEKGCITWISEASVSLDRKVCALSFLRGMACYDTRDGSCETSELPDDYWLKTRVCVIENVLYVYYSRFGLMWYDSQLMIWRVVYGLDLGKAGCVGIAEYYGKLAFLWEEEPSLVCSESKEIWCRMIGLVRSDVGIHGTAEPSQLLEIVPHSYTMYHCLSLSG